MLHCSPFEIDCQTLCARLESKKMNYHELSKQINKDLYADIIECGGLSAALAKAMADLPGSLQVSTAENFIPYARVEDKSRFSQMYIASQKRLFLFDFWSEGVTYGKGASSILSQAAQAIHFWIYEKPSIAVMQKQFEIFRPTEEGKAHEIDQIVEYQWDRLLNSWREGDSPDHMSPLPVIQAARKRPELRQLFPFTSLRRVCFSRTTGYPFTNDCPYAVPLGNGRYRAYSAKYTLEKRTCDETDDLEEVYEVIGEGSAEEVVEMLVMNLPPNCGAAINGTAEDVISNEEKSED
jgi:hypothetical protein